MGYQLDEVIIPSTVTDGKRTYTVTKIAYDKAQNISNKSYGAFQNSKINRVVIPYTVTTIGTSAFNGSSVVNIDFEAAPDEIDDSPLKIEQNAFTNCTKLEYLELMREHFAQDMTTSNIFSGCKSLKSAFWHLQACCRRDSSPIAHRCSALSSRIILKVSPITLSATAQA